MARKEGKERRKGKGWVGGRSTKEQDREKRSSAPVYNTFMASFTFSSGRGWTPWSFYLYVPFMLSLVLFG